jgi:hypothetical protein
MSYRFVVSARGEAASGVHEMLGSADLEIEAHPPSKWKMSEQNWKTIFSNYVLTFFILLAEILQQRNQTHNDNDTFLYKVSLSLCLTS